MIPIQQTSYPSQPTGYPPNEMNQHQMISQPTTSQNIISQNEKQQNEIRQVGVQENNLQPASTHQLIKNQFDQKIPPMTSNQEPPPPYTPQVISPIPHPTPVAIQIPMVQTLPNPNIVINNGNDNKVGSQNGQSPEQIAALINMQLVKCPFCGLGTLKKGIKYSQMIIFCLITVFFFPFGLLIWCCLCCNSVHKRSCTNCGVEA